MRKLAAATPTPCSTIKSEKPRRRDLVKNVAGRTHSRPIRQLPE
jgi:hypothetical protein